MISTFFSVFPGKFDYKCLKWSILRHVLCDKRKLSTCWNDQRLLEPVNIGWGISPDDTSHFVVLLETRVLNFRRVLPRDADWNFVKYCLNNLQTIEKRRRIIHWKERICWKGFKYDWMLKKWLGLRKKGWLISFLISQNIDIFTSIEYVDM